MSAETYNGKPCKTCGTTEKYLSSKTCVECKKIQGKNRRRNPLVVKFKDDIKYQAWI